MRSVLRRLSAVAVIVVITGQVALAEPKYRDRSVGERIKRFVISVLDELGVPHP
jgi:hypothetical protein